ncbi:S41 family peptidase [candidate division NPL-UPA2 bacterium Unc8]|uniref:S41 family peptidase n=1 Tax=candidate division NPL-UPA2 bacterium Unc8 TaxID=1980939 RepID=A0A399FV09_UNCN2|nr:MAG: S41 family peptidase [candidate division NPL-UPA2 bacterium Unc8]
MKVKISILALFFLLSCGNALAETTKEKGMFDQLRRLARTIELIRREYVDEVDLDKLIEGALRGMLNALDPASQFLDAESFEEIMIRSKGEFEGVGMTITIRDKVLTVIAPLKGFPAARAGIRAGDKIIEIDGESTMPLTLMESVHRLRGPAGTDVTITIVREGDVLPEITLTREKIELVSVEEELLEDNIGHIHIIHFHQDTPEEFVKALQSLKERGMESLILDLRGNSGGLLDAAIKVTDKFLNKGKLIVRVEGRRDFYEFLSQQHPLFEHPLIVLIDGGSASGAEIIAGAIKDWGRGILVGERTFGKASVQAVISLGDGSHIRLTTARYFTPGGYTIHDEGIAPDILIERIEKIEEKEVPDPQLEAAINILKAWPFFKEIHLRDTLQKHICQRQE